MPDTNFAMKTYYGKRNSIMLEPLRLSMGEFADVSSNDSPTGKSLRLQSDILRKQTQESFDERIDNSSIFKVHKIARNYLGEYT